jgi:hypothetical protein
MTADGNPFRPVRHLDGRGFLTPSRRRAKIGSEGFTILELLVAMVLTVFGVLGFTGLLKVIGNVEAEDLRETKALFCAQERMEELKFAFLTGNGFTTEGEEIVAEGSYTGMRREWTTGESDVFERLLEINVGCAYPWKGSMKSVELSTLVCLED